MSACTQCGFPSNASDGLCDKCRAEKFGEKFEGETSVFPPPPPPVVNVQAPIDVHLPCESPRLRDEEVWLRAWLAVSASSNCNKSDVSVRWADECLDDFKKRFRK